MRYLPLALLAVLGVLLVVMVAYSWNLRLQAGRREASGVRIRFLRWSVVVCAVAALVTAAGLAVGDRPLWPMFAVAWLFAEWLGRGFYVDAYERGLFLGTVPFIAWERVEDYAWEADGTLRIDVTESGPLRYRIASSGREPLEAAFHQHVRRGKGGRRRAGGRSNA